MTILRHRLAKLNRWQRASFTALCSWLLVCILITVYRFPTEEKLRSAWVAASEETLAGDRNVIDAADAECRRLTSASGYSASLLCIDDVLHMRYAYQDRLNGLISYGDKQAREELLPNQMFAVAEGIALWVIPPFCLYMFGLSVARLKKRVEQPPYQVSGQTVAQDVFRWPDRTRRKPRRS
jgi:hypothetical protein